MNKIINKYLSKLEAQGLARSADCTFMALDADMYSNRPSGGESDVLREVFKKISISSLLYARPSEPYWSMIEAVIGYDTACSAGSRITPMDCETRTFFHDIPVIDEFSAGAIAAALSHRKAVIVKGWGIVTYGVVTPEQAYVSFSSTCFSIFVKYFLDALTRFRAASDSRQRLADEYVSSFRAIVRSSEIHQQPHSWQPLKAGPPGSDEQVLQMMAEAGRALVGRGLVDSFFGNISFLFRDRIFVSQTGSSLDELEGCIDIVPLDGSSSAGITASSELPAHRRIYELTGCSTILHGHPRFSVIMSMLCDKEGCDRSLCYKACSEEREVCDVPIVAGEIGTGATGLLNTVPAAMQKSGAAIVYGHGLFVSGKGSFRGPMEMMTRTEERCREAYFRLADGLLRSR